MLLSLLKQYEYRRGTLKTSENICLNVTNLNVAPPPQNSQLTRVIYDALDKTWPHPWVIFSKIQSCFPVYSVYTASTAMFFDDQPSLRLHAIYLAYKHIYILSFWSKRWGLTSSKVERS